MKVLLLVGVCVALVTVGSAWEDWMFPMMFMQQQQQRQQQAYYPPPPPQSVYSHPVDSSAGWQNAPRAPVRDAAWYDNNT